MAQHSIHLSGPSQFSLDPHLLASLPPLSSRLLLWFSCGGHPLTNFFGTSSLHVPVTVTASPPRFQSPHWREEPSSNLLPCPLSSSYLPGAVTTFIPFSNWSFLKLRNLYIKISLFNYWCGFSTWYTLFMKLWLDILSSHSPTSFTFLICYLSLCAIFA